MHDDHDTNASRRRRRVVIVGGGFAGLRAARKLGSVDVDITLIDRRNHHLFQPLLYQVACAGLAPADIAIPLRRALRRADNVTTLMAEVSDVDLQRRRVRLGDGAEIGYDYLVLAAGSEPNYHGHDEWAPLAPSLKSLDSALRLRERILLAFERAEREPDAAARRRLLSFAVVGAGPTGVELAGAIAELGRLGLARDYRHIQPGDVRVTLLEMRDRVLPSFDPRSSLAATQMLEELGVDVRLDREVELIEEGCIVDDDGPLIASTTCWASGVKPVPLAARLAQVLEHDDTGRILVEPDCSLRHHREVFVLGDMACHRASDDAPPLPALAAVAVQQGAHAADAIGRDLRQRSRRAFRYRDLGTLATVGRGRAIAELGPWHLAGASAWALWSWVHIQKVAGARNRLRVLLDWAWQYLTPTRRPGARIITGRDRDLDLSASTS